MVFSKPAMSFREAGLDGVQTRIPLDNGTRVKVVEFYVSRYQDTTNMYKSIARSAGVCVCS